MAPTRFIRWFRDITMADVGLVGGKNASLGEMYRELMPRGIRVPNGFAITADSYRHVLRVGSLAEKIRSILADLNTADLTNLAERGRRVRDAILATPFADLQQEICERETNPGGALPGMRGRKVQLHRSSASRTALASISPTKID